MKVVCVETSPTPDGKKQSSSIRLGVIFTGQLRSELKFAQGQRHEKILTSGG